MKPEKLAKSKFPKALLEIPQPPKDLWVLGEMPDPDLVHLCVVGSRKYTTYGKESCEKLIAGLKGYPIVIVSGLAMGIDAIAHRAALRAGLKTLVFPGSGISPSAMYPRTNVKLAEEILENGGCLISEFEPTFKATLYSFPMRNRLMAALSRATLVIEADEKSGTLITARLATEYNRDVLVVPGSIFSPTSRGTNRLLRQGATPITKSEDLLDALGFEIKKEKQTSLFSDLSPIEKKLVAFLREPMPRDEIIQALGLSTQEANTLISVMEIKELIKEEMGEIKLIV